MRAVRILVSLMILATLASCADDDGGAEPQGGGDLEGITWILDEGAVLFLGDGEAVEARATIRFEDGEIGGTAFCNMYGGTYEVGDDGSLSLHLGAMTEMACEEPVGSLETAFIAALGEVTGSTVGDGTLELTRDDGPALSFTAEQALPLVETAWRLDGITTGSDAVSSTVAGTEVTATFAGDGTLSGNGGCNTYNTGYTVDGDALVVDGAIATTKMACEPDVMDQEVAYLAALAETATFGIEGSTLPLSDADGGFLLSFVAGAA